MAAGLRAAGPTARASFAASAARSTVVSVIPARPATNKLPPRRRFWDAPVMPPLPVTSTEDVLDQPVRAQFEAFLDEHRAELNRSLDGLTEEQARAAHADPVAAHP